MSRRLLRTKGKGPHAQLLALGIFCIYSYRMDLTFDPAKDRINREKHGISLAAAADLDWDMAIDWEDTRRNYQEKRICALAPIGNRIYYVVYVERNGTRRIISLRKANAREAHAYVNKI